MKKATGSILTAAVCVGLSLSAFTLSGFASTGMQTGTVNVMEKETPKEYMADFSVAEEVVGMQPDITKYMNTIFVSESQVESLKKNTEKVLVEDYGVKIPEGLAFEYNTIDIDGMKIRLNWSDGKSEYRDSVGFFAEYEIMGLQGSELKTVLNSISMVSGYNSGYDLKSLDSLKKQALEALKNELGIDVPENYSVYAGVGVHFDGGQQQNVTVGFEWAKDVLSVDADHYATPCYTVGFDKVDLSKNTGKVTMVEDNLVAFGKPSDSEAKLPELTKEQENKMLEAAKQFFAEKGITVENLVSRGGATRSYQLDRDGGKVMWFVFEPVEKNNSSRTYIEIFITPEFDVLGYAY